jgi:hypothetical protein
MSDSHERSDLTLVRAREHVLTKLAGRWPEVSFTISDPETLVRGFGWVFTIDAHDNGHTVDRASVPRLVLIDRVSAQTVTTLRTCTADHFAALFEELQAWSLATARNWCGTMGLRNVVSQRKRIAEKGRSAGLWELS